MNEKELKPCPFCGGQAQLDHEGTGRNVYSKVRCMKCYCVTKGFMISTEHSSDEKAIEAWSRRVEDE